MIIFIDVKIRKLYLNMGMKNKIFYLLITILRHFEYIILYIY